MAETKTKKRRSLKDRAKALAKRVKGLKGSHGRKVGPLAPKAGVGTHNRYRDGGRLPEA